MFTCQKLGGKENYELLVISINIYVHVHKAYVLGESILCGEDLGLRFCLEFIDCSYMFSHTHTHTHTHSKPLVVHLSDTLPESDVLILQCEPGNFSNILEVVSTSCAFVPSTSSTLVYTILTRNYVLPFC